MTYTAALTQVARFTTLALAQDYAAQERNRWIVLGDDDQFWVTTYRVASYLERVGYALISTYGGTPCQTD